MEEELCPKRILKELVKRALLQSREESDENVDNKKANVYASNINEVKNTDAFNCVITNRLQMKASRMDVKSEATLCVVEEKGIGEAKVEEYNTISTTNDSGILGFDDSGMSRVGSKT